MMNKFIFLVFLFALSSCSGLREKLKESNANKISTPAVSELAGEWMFQSNSSLICADSGPYFQNCEITLSFDADLKCLGAEEKTTNSRYSGEKRTLECETSAAQPVNPKQKKIALYYNSVFLLDGILHIRVEQAKKDGTPAMRLTSNKVPPQIFPLVKTSNDVKIP